MFKSTSSSDRKKNLNLPLAEISYKSIKSNTDSHLPIVSVIPNIFVAQEERLEKDVFLLFG